MKNSSAKQKLMLICGVFLIFSLFFFVRPVSIDTASLTSASATLSNSRLSFLGKAVSAPSGGVGIGMTASAYMDDDTTHLFPQDSIYIGQTSPSFTVQGIEDSAHFSLSAGIGASIADNTDIWVKQTSQVTISVGLATTVPASGYVQVTIPDPPSDGNDQKPDSVATLANSGFDLNGLGTGGTAYFTVIGSSGCNTTWTGAKTLTVGSGSGHTFKQITSSQCPGGTLTITLGSTTPATQMLNPAPARDRASQGTGDRYTFTVKTYDAFDTLLDTVDVKVALIEGVLVSATIDSSLGFTVAGVGSGTTNPCGVTTSVTTNAYSVPWSTVSDYSTFHDAAQLLTVNTNADNGYSVTVQENDQMKRDGATCTGGNQSEASSCVKNTTCDGGACTTATAKAWTTTSTYGFGYSMRNSSGSDSAFNYTDDSSTFAARQFADAADIGVGATGAVIMSNAGPVNGSASWVCYRLNVSAIQPAGYYQNVVKFIATPTF